MGKLDGLATRFKKAIKDRDHARQEAEEEARRAAEESARRAADEKKRKTEARKARAAMLDELVGFAEAIGLSVKRNGPAVIVTYEDKALGFEEAGDEDRIAVSWEGGTDTDHMARDDGAWIITRTVDGFGRHLGLEEGLEDLFIDALGLPNPDDPTAGVASDSIRFEAAVEAEVAPEPATPAAPAKPPSPAPARGSNHRGTPGSAVKDLSNPWD